MLGPGPIWIWVYLDPVFGPGAYLDPGLFGPGPNWTGAYLDPGVFGRGPIWTWAYFDPGLFGPRPMGLGGRAALQPVGSSPFRGIHVQASYISFEQNLNLSASVKPPHFVCFP